MRLATPVRWSARTAAGLLLAALAVVPVSAGGGGGSGVMPVNSRMHGQTYGEWAAAWYQWAYSMPADEHPLFELADPSAGQSGKVWFLGGTFLSTEAGPNHYLGESLDRRVTVPAGTALFFPVMNAGANELEGDGTTEDELRARAALLAGLIDPDSLFLKVDGRPAGVGDWADYRVQSPLFRVGPLPDGNLSQAFGYDVPAGSVGHMVTDGYYVMLNPLPVGTHTIEFGGFLDATELFGITFELHIRYEVTVAPARR